MIKTDSFTDRALFGAALGLGVLAVSWTAMIFATRNAMAFTITVVIGMVFTIGVVELFNFGRATATLTTALGKAQASIDNLQDWLDTIAPSLRSAVRLRIEGARVGLPAPLLTPYLVGLLVMLGLLGTFVGMVDTLHGAVAALEGTTELQAIRQGLAAPIDGLGMAFGTSVAGVATSAMLGLMSAIVRRRRVLETRRLDASDLSRFSLEHSQRETFAALQRQTQSLPALAGTLDRVAAKLDQVGQNLVDSQKGFQQTVAEQYTQLAQKIEKSLDQNLTANTRLVGAAIEPIVKQTMAAMTRQTQHAFEDLSRIGRQSLENTNKQLADQSRANQTACSDMLAAFDQGSKARITHLEGALEAFLNRHNEQAASLNHAFDAAMDGWIARQDADEEKRISRWNQALQDLTANTKTLGEHMRAQVLGLTKSATDLIESRRETESAWIEDHTARMDGLGVTMQKIDALCGALEGNLSRQHQTIEALTTSSKEMLAKVGDRFSEKVDRDMSRLTTATDAFSVSTTEMACLGESFGKAVDLFIDANQTLIENLSGIQSALENASARSDDQLGYVVAQARDIIDHSILAQQEIVAELRQLAPQPILRREAN